MGPLFQRRLHNFAQTFLVYNLPPLTNYSVGYDGMRTLMIPRKYILPQQLVEIVKPCPYLE